MNILGRIKCALSQSSWDKMLRDWLSGRDDIAPTGDIAVSGYQSLKFSAVFACLRVLAETFSSVPIAEYVKLKNGDRQKTDETGLLTVLRDSPNEEMDAYNFFALGMYQVNTGGNFVCEKVLTRYGEITQLLPYDWQTVEIKRDEVSKKLRYDIRIDAQNTAKRYRQEIFHVAGPSLNGIVGMSPIEFAADAIKLGRTYEKFSVNFYKNGAIPSGIFEHPTHLKDDAFKRLKEDLETNWQGLMNAGRPILAEDGLKFHELSMKLVDAELLSSKKFQIEDICRIYRVPLHLVQNLDRATNNNIEHQSLEFVMYTMLPWFKRWESAINNQLLTVDQRKAGYYFEFNLAGLLRGDQKSMAEAFAIGRQWGYLSVNDIRRMLNMNSVPNGDIYLQPMNMIEAGTQVDPAISAEIAKLIESRGK